MKPRYLGLVFIVLLTAFGAIGWATPASEAASAPREDQGPRFLYPGADFVHVFQQDCLPNGRVRMQVSWNSYGLGPQWVDLTLFNNNWVWGTFLGAGPIATGANYMYWDGLLPGLTHYVRVNTLTPNGWWPSATIQFNTRSDCALQVDSDGDGIPNNLDACPFQYGPSWNNGCPVQPPLDSDGDGVPNSIDACPFQPGPSWNNGCPVQPPQVRCDPVSGWCPGDAPPALCGAFIQVIAPLGCVWVTRGEGSTYHVGEQIIVCYWVSQPMNVRVQTQKPDGTFVDAFTPGFDDGRGDCVAGTVGTPTGQRTTRLYTGAAFNQLLDSTSWVVQ